MVTKPRNGVVIGTAHFQSKDSQHRTGPFGCASPARGDNLDEGSGWATCCRSGCPRGDEPLRKRRQSGSLKPFLIAFVSSSLIGYLVNLMLLWRVLAVRALTERLGEAFIPGVLIVLSCIGMWILLTVFVVALAQEPKVRRTLKKEIADHQVNAEARAFAEQTAARTTTTTATKQPT
jgi:hypothetical protein